jgi:hypothetical protein
VQPTLVSLDNVDRLPLLNEKQLSSRRTITQVDGLCIAISGVVLEPNGTKTLDVALGRNVRARNLRRKLISPRGNSHRLSHALQYAKVAGPFLPGVLGHKVYLPSRKEEEIGPRVEPTDYGPLGIERDCGRSTLFQIRSLHDENMCGE